MKYFFFIIFHGRLEDIKKELDAGSIPPVETMKKTISLAVKVMERKQSQR